MNKILFLSLVMSIAMGFTASAQTITVQPNVTTELNLYSDISLWISAPAGQEVNAEFLYFTATSDTSTTSVLTNTSLGVSHQFVFQNVVVSCDSLWNGFVNVWITGQDTIQSEMVSWSLPCAGDVAVGFSVEEIIDIGVVISLDYNSGGIPAGLYWFTAVNGDPLLLNSEIIFGVGTHRDTLFIEAGTTYEVCYPEVNNGVDVAFLPECIIGEMASFAPSSPDVVFSFTGTIDSLNTTLLVSNSGNLSSDFEVVVERMLCNGSYEVYETFEVSFDQLVLDSLVVFPTLTNLPQAPAWRATVGGSNGDFNLSPESVVVDLALTAPAPSASLSLTDEGGGWYNAVVTWNDQGSGNVLISLYVSDELVATISPDTSPLVVPLPQIGAYSDALVEMVFTSNSCWVVEAMSFIAACSPTPTHVLESAYGITTTSANVQISLANFHGCVDDAMVGIILVGVDTVWTPLSVNTEESANYIIQLTNLTPGQIYVYLGVLYAEGDYFTTNFSLSFTTLSDEPVEPYFTNFNVNWDMSMLITLFMYYDLGDFASAGLRVYHDGPNNPEVEVLDVTVSNEFTSFDYSLQGQYGTHIVWAELYNTQTNVVYETVGPSIHTFQQPVGVVEFGQPITRFDTVMMYDLSGRMVAEWRNGEILSPELSAGVYLFVGRKEEECVSSKIYLE